MNMDKTIMLLAGAHRGFSVAGGSEAASMLRDVGLSTAYDVTNGQVHNLPGSKRQRSTSTTTARQREPSGSKLQRLGCRRREKVWT